MARTSPVHYIAPSALSITPNANGSENDISVYVTTGTKIRIYSPANGLATNNAYFLEWTLAGKNRRLSNSEKPYTIYVRLDKTDKAKGYVIFAEKQLSEDGNRWTDKYPSITLNGLEKKYTDESGTHAEKIGNYESNYWFVRIGDVSIPEEGQRTLSFDTGILGTEQFNAEWNLDPDDMPMRVLINASVDGIDAGPNPYVPWEKQMILTASLVEGWEADADALIDHWQIVRNTGDAAADDTWLSDERATDFGKSGNISLAHQRGMGDDFNGSVSAMFTVMAWGTNESDENEKVLLASASISVMAETAEKYELELSDAMVAYDPSTDAYSPASGVKVRIRATDQRGTVFKMTKGQFDNASLRVQYALSEAQTWNILAFNNLETEIAEAVIPVEFFHAQKGANVRIMSVYVDDEGQETLTEIFRTPIAFVRNGEDTKEREWIYLRSRNAAIFGEEGSDYLLPALIEAGEVEPEGEATALDTNKQQDGWVPAGWWDEMQGTNEEFHYEYSAYRDYIRNNVSESENEDAGNASERGGYWGDFSTPRIWSYYAEDAVNYRCRWTLNGEEVFQLVAAYTGAFRGVLPLTASLMKRKGNGSEELVASSQCVITLACDGIDYEKIINATNPTVSVSSSENNEFVNHMNNVALNALLVKFSVNGEEYSFSIPVIREADEDSIKHTMEEKGSELFLSKKKDDTAEGKITFKDLIKLIKGLKIGGEDSRYGIDENANAVLADTTVWGIIRAFAQLYANHIESDNWTGDGSLCSGFQLMRDSMGITSLVVDKLLVRIKAVFNKLEIRELSYVGGNIELSGAGSKLHIVTNLYREGEDVPYAFRCYLIKDDGTSSTRNWWKIGDQAKCQTFNIDGSEVKNGEQTLSVDGEMITQNGELVTYDDGRGGSTGNKYYWRLVTAIGTETLSDGRLYDWIELANEKTVSLTVDGVTYTCEGMDSVFDGYDLDNMKWHEMANDYPAQGDNIVQEGNQIDEERQHFIRLNTVGENAPSIEEFSNVGARDGISPWNLSKRRMTVIAPRTGDVFVAKRFEMLTDSGTRIQVPVERGEYTDGMVCNYYDRVSHNGSLWLCVCKIGNKVNDTIYPPSEEYKLTDGSKIWLEQIKRGGDGYTVELTPSTMMITQNTDGNFNFSENRVYYKVFAASSDITDDCKLLEATADNGCNVTTDTDGAEREYVVITSLNGQPDSGKIGIKIGLSNGDVINRELKYYVNYLGSLRDELQNYTIVFSPNVVILNESDDGTFDFEKHWVSFKVFKGKDDITYKTQLINVAGDYDASTGYGCLADRIEDNDGNIVIAIQNIIGRPEKGKIQATFNVDGYTIVRSIDYYINWLGTFRHTIENDVSKMIAEKTTVTVNGENVSINDAVSQLEQTSKSISSRVENAVTEMNGNISTIEKSVSEISQTSNAINMAVYGDDTTEYITSFAGFKLATGSSHTYSFDDKSDLVKRMYAGAKIVAKIGVSAMSDLTNDYGSFTMKLLVNGNVIAKKTFDYEDLNYDWSTLCTLEATWGITVAVNTIELVIENNLGDWIDEDSGISDEITITSHSIKRKTIVSKEVEDGLSRTGIDITQGKITLDAETTEFTGDVNIYGTIQESNKQKDDANRFYPIDFVNNRSISIPAQSLVVLPMYEEVKCEAGGYFKDGYTFPAFQKAGTNVTITAMPVTEIANWSCMKTKLSINGSEVKEVVALDYGLIEQNEFQTMHTYMSLVCADPRLFAKYDIGKLVSTAETAESGYGMSIESNNQGKNFFGNMHGRFLVNGSFTRFIALLPGQMLKLKSVIMYGYKSGDIVKFSMSSDGGFQPIVFWNVENASDFRPIHFSMKEGERNEYFFYPTSGKLSPLTSFNKDFRETVYGHKMLEDSMWGINGNGASGVITEDNGKPRFYSGEILRL